MGLGNGMIPMQGGSSGQVPSMVPVGMPQGGHHMQGAPQTVAQWASHMA